MTGTGEPTGSLHSEDTNDEDFSNFLQVIRAPSAEKKKWDDNNGEGIGGSKPVAGVLPTDLGEDSFDTNVKDVDAAAAVVRLGPKDCSVDEDIGNAENRKRRRCDTWSEFISTFLFFSSSVIYVTMAVKDYQWAQKLLDMPMHIRTADDDISWYNYIIEERYNASLLEEQEAAAMNRAGGVRRMKTREHFRRLLEEEEDQARKLRAHESAQELDVVVAPMETLGLLGRRLQTPEELYYNLCWAELPQEIQDAYTVLGTTENVWDNGATTELSLEVADSWWNELTDEQLEAASFIGYTQELWNVDDNGNPITTPAPIGVPRSESPTKQPTPRPVTDSPTKRPTVKPVTDSPTRRPTRKPTRQPTREPTKQPTPEPSPVITPETSPSTAATNSIPSSVQDAWTSPAFSEWSDLVTNLRYALIILGYDGLLWNSGETVPADELSWSELSGAEKFGAAFLGYDAISWDVTEAGEHFPYQPSLIILDNNEEDLAGVETVSAPPSTSPVATESPTGEPTKNPVEEPSFEPSKRPSLPPSLSPIRSPVTSTPTSASSAPVLVQNMEPVTPPPAEVTSISEGATLGATTLPLTDTNMADPDVPASPTPEELYYDEYWADLPTAIQDAYAVLGLNETMWNFGIPSEASDYWWHELPAEMQEAARFIGYTKEIWCMTVTLTVSPTPAQVAQSVQSPTSPASLFGGTSAPVEVVQPVFTPVLPMSPSSSDAVQESLVAPDDNPAPSLPNTPTTDPNSPEALYYDEYWADLPPDIQAAYSVLGLDETKWNLALPSEAGDYYWDELPPEMREAAIFIGYNEEIWCSTTAPTSSPYVSSMNDTGVTVSIFNMPRNETETEDTELSVPAGFYDNYGWAELPPHIQDAATTLGYSQTIWDTGGYSWAEDTFWDELTLEQKEAGALLGYDKYSWDGIDPITGDAVLDDDFVSYDDDYVFSFQVGSSDVWVSQYQILYFVAASSFLLVGVLDLIRERHMYHILMIIAGASGVVSAIFIEQNIRVSNIVSSISVHFYLMEALTLFGEHKRYAVTEDSGKWMARSIMIGDATWVLGSLLDVILSYFYLLDDTSDWDVSLVVLAIIAAVGWLICSIIYLGIFAYVTKVSFNED
eukprot:CAMPEP_0196136300 /NCGR_PEP_ID=MMETSP0910-20130528/4651_1 /TAXON_ID=49265 /ORGANISM="Thalassiosira rotula, Strain GSO102" /LENGTH=1111 /DNA_ID=CAMNT_0041396565 /DNA_START=109 /DNA_END=3444 /DNA_ORIENTATION=+